MNIPRLIARCAMAVAATTFALTATVAQAQEAASTSGWPAWLQEAMAKEAPKLRSKKITVGGDFLKTRLAGKPAEPQAIDGGWYIASDIGTPSPLECWVFSSLIDPATMVANVADLSMKSSETAEAVIGNRSIYSVDAGAFGGAPYLALEWLYTIGEAPNALIGLVKVRLAMVNDTPLVCGHNSLGYRDTFAKAFEEFVRESQLSGPAPTHFYEEVFVQKIGQQPIGVARSTFTRDDTGDTAILIMESFLFPLDGATLTTSDTWRSSSSRADGTLIDQVSAKSANGELDMQLSLDRMESGAWAVSGTFQGKEINQEISGDTQPMSDIGQMHAVRNLLADTEQQNATLPVWVPEADPTQFLEAGVALQEGGRKDGRVLLTIGPMELDARFDKHGSLVTGGMQAGASQMLIERVWTHGSPP